MPGGWGGREREGEDGQTDERARETLFHEHAQGQAQGLWGPRE